MSKRYTNRNDGTRGFNKNQMKFVPKTQNPPLTNPHPNSKLSASLRQSFSEQSDRSSVSAVASTSRVRLGDNGEWVSSRAQGGNFVKYLPQDEAVAAGLGAEEGGLDPVESQRVVDLLNRELSRLLKLKPKQFWKKVAGDASLHDFLDSFLQFRSRWYDFPYHGTKGIVAGVIVGELELTRRVFMLLYRISSNRDPGARAAESLSPKDHGVLLQETKLLDLPKLLDICAIYGHENENLTRLLVGNAFRAQPWLHDKLTSMLAHFLGIVNTMHQRCSSSLEVILSAESHDERESSQLRSNFLEVMDFINDAVVSMDALVTAYKPAAVFFSCPVETSCGNEELISMLARLHDLLLPSLQKGLRTILNVGEDDMLSSIVASLKMLSTRLVNLGWKLLESCYLSNDMFEGRLPVPAASKMFPARLEDPSIRGDILIQMLREISELSLLIQENSKGTFIRNIEKSFSLISRLESLLKSGWIFMDDEQFQYISRITGNSQKEKIKESAHQSDSLTSHKVEMDEDAAIIESKISQIKDLFPDYGNGFLAACLEVYNQNPEEVIQRILEGTLHEDLQSLDTSLEKIQPKHSSTVGRTDKGKGIMTGTTSAQSTNMLARAQEQQTSSASSSSRGRYVRKSKDDWNNPGILNVRDEKDAAKTTAVISQYEYEDEYDDSFDDLGLNVVDSGLEENEILGDRITSTMGKETGSVSRTQNTSSAKWGSRNKPQFYVKDGKNYSYKVAGAVAVTDAKEASLVTQAQSELIYGLGRGGNLPLGAVKKLVECQNDQNNHSGIPETEGRGNMGNQRAQGGRGKGRQRGSYKAQGDLSSVNGEEGPGDVGNQRGRGRRGGGRNHYRKDRAMNKHFSSVGGY